MRDYLLDTNAFIHLARGKSIATQVLADLKLDRSSAFFMSAVSVGEIEFLGLQSGWGQSTKDRLSAAVQRSLVIDLNFPGLYQAYAEIQFEARVRRKPSINNKDNDVWIAASARATGACLVSADKWFLNIGGSLINLAYFDANTGAVSQHLIP